MPRKKPAPAESPIASIEAQNVSPIRKAARVSSAAEKLLATIPESGLITVGCKLPRGLKMRVFRMIPHAENVMGGGVRETTIAQQEGDIVSLKGYAVPFGKTAKFPIIGDFGLTEGVDAEFFREFIKQNADSDFVKAGLIFCHKDLNAARDMATERQDLKCGFEPGDPDGDPRAPKRNREQLSDIEDANKKKD